MECTEFLLWDDTTLTKGEGFSVSLRIEGRPGDTVKTIRIRDLKPLLDTETLLPWARITADEWPVQVTALRVDLARRKVELRGMLVPEAAGDE